MSARYKFFWIFFFISLYFSNTAFASVYVLCAKEISPDSLDLEGYELELSSQEDLFQGPVGGSWEMRIEREGDWLAMITGIVAKNYLFKQMSIVEVRVSAGILKNEEALVIYRLVDIYGENPYLEKFHLENSKAPVKIAQFQCLSSVD